MRWIVYSAVFSLLALGVFRLLAPRVLRWRVMVGILAAGLLVHLAWYATRAELLSGELAFLARVVSTAWTVTALIGVLGLGPVAVVLRVAGWIRARRKAAPVLREEPVDQARRRFLGGAALPVLAVTTGAGGTVAGLRPFEVREEEVRVKGLPRALEGFRIGQITDVHVGDFIDVDHVRRAVAAMNEAGCDLQVMTGDLIDDLSQLEETMQALAANGARHGMIAILGNHEIWQGEEEVRQAYERHGADGRLRLLVDQSLRLDHDGASLHVVGVDYPMHRGGRHRLPPEERDALMRSSAERAFGLVGGEETVLCLTHHPDFFPIAADRGAHLTLAGHTHGGQVGLFGFPLFRFAYDYMLGRYRRGGSHLYVSGGTGHWLPFRVGVPTEVTILTLRAA